MDTSGRSGIGRAVNQLINIAARISGCKAGGLNESSILINFEERWLFAEAASIVILSHSDLLDHGMLRLCSAPIGYTLPLLTYYDAIVQIMWGWLLVRMQKYPTHTHFEDVFGFITKA